MMQTSLARWAALAIGDVAALAVLRPRPHRLVTGLAHPNAWISDVGIDRAVASVCGTLIWVAAAWIALGLLASLGSRLPGLAGRASGRCGRVLLPRVLYRVVAGSVGLGVLLSPVVARAAVPTNGAAVSHQLARGEADVPSPAWPVSPGATPPGPAPVPLTPPTWPAGTAPTTAHADGAERRIRPGDSLWMVAARRLGPDATNAQLAHYWPRLYATNRTVIGDDPSLIRPGLVLDLPAPTPQETP